MANDTTAGHNSWVLDTVGFIYPGTVYIQSIMMIPNAAGDEAVFKTWSEDSVVASGSGILLVGAISSNSIFTSTGNLTSVIADGHVFRILKSTGEVANLTRRVVQTAGNNNAITVHHEIGDWTDEDPATYNWETYATYNANDLYLKAGASDTSPVRKDFGIAGRRIHNLTLETLTSSAKLYVNLVGGTPGLV